MNIRPLESLTKDELIELIKHERENHSVETTAAISLEHVADVLHMAQDGWKLVPVEPTTEMKNAGIGVEVYAIPVDVGCMTWAEARAVYKAMLAAAPQPDPRKMIPSDRSMKEIKATLAAAKGKEHTLTFSAKEIRGLLNIIVNQNTRIERFEKKIADHVAQERKKPTDTEMLDWMIDNEAFICYSVTDNLYEVWFGIDNVETGKTAREAIANAMRGEK